MATQGILSIVGSDGKTVVKCICGCNGYNIDALKDSIIIRNLYKAEEIYNEAIKNRVGCLDCLVVMSKDEIFSVHPESELSELYQSTFSDPRFNPRWIHGTADHIEVISNKTEE